MNSELTEWSGKYGLPRFDLIGDDDFAPAMKAALAEADAAVEAIAANPEPATFQNTVAALEQAEEPLDKVAAVFYTLTGVDFEPEARGAQPRVRAASGRAWQQDRHGQAAV